MKKYYLLTLLLIYTCVDISANTDILQFNRQDISVSDNIFRYGNLDNILLPNGISLPYQTIYIKTADYAQIPQISLKSLSSEIITSNLQVDAEDIPTTFDKSLYTDIISSAEFDKLGFKPLCVIDKITIVDNEYYKCMQFPITISLSGEATFHAQTEISYNNNKVAESDIISQEEIQLLENKKNSFLKTQSNSTSYVIITNQALVNSFEKLSRYKNQIGISTEIQLIENILSSYSGRDDAEKMREYLKDFYTDGGQYVLLGGDETVLPIRYTYHNIAYTNIDLENQQVCDLYFADLTGDWNADNDSVWGEKYTDSVDLTPELYVGRLPFNTTIEVEQYIEKLIQYETNKNQIDLSYLEKTFFFCSDEMRDFGTIGQHGLIAEAFPDNFSIDTTNGVEYSAGNDLNPTNLISKELEPIISEGYGIVNIIAHGSSMTFGVRTSNYNDWPKSYFTTDTGLTESGIVSNFESNNKLSLYLSLGCDNGAFDKDQPPFNHMSPNMVQTLLAQKQSGAVAFVANTRWGWVSSSYLLQKRFVEYLFANPDQPAVDALYKMKNDYYYYRDLIYGINYFGDPTMIIYTKKPEPLDIDITYSQSQILITTLSENTSLANTTIYLSDSNSIIAEYLTDENGQAVVDLVPDLGTTYTVSAVHNGHTITQKTYTPSIATDIDDETEIGLPASFALGQNYPNPFNPNTTISFSLPFRDNISIIVYNMAGQKVRTIADGSYSAGNHIVEWDGKDNSGNNTATGIYLYRFKSSEITEVKKMMLLR